MPTPQYIQYYKQYSLPNLFRNIYGFPVTQYWNKYWRGNGNNKSVNKEYQIAAATSAPSNMFSYLCGRHWLLQLYV